VTAAPGRSYAGYVPKVRAVHHRPKILIAGAGVAGLETLLALRSLLGGTVEIELLAAEPEFVYHPLAVAAPFGLGEVRRIDLAAVAADHDAHLRLGALAAVDAAASVAQTEGGQALAYDFLVVAIGARRWPAIEGALTFTGGEDLEPFGEADRPRAGRDRATAGVCRRHRRRVAAAAV